MFRPTRSGGHGYAVVHCSTARGRRARRTRCAAASSSRMSLMPLDSRIGRPVAIIASSSATLPISPDGTFHIDIPTRVSSSTASIEKGELRNKIPSSVAWSASPCHCAFREFHPLPVVVSGSVLLAEIDSERFAGGTLRAGNVRLKFHGVGAGPRYFIDEGMRVADTAVVRQSHLADDETTTAFELGQRQSITPPRWLLVRWRLRAAADPPGRAPAARRRDP